MATKISDLASLAEADVVAADDVLAIVDTSATTTKKVSVQSIRGIKYSATRGQVLVGPNTSGRIDEGDIEEAMLAVADDNGGKEYATAIRGVAVGRTDDDAEVVGLWGEARITAAVGADVILEAVRAQAVATMGGSANETTGLAATNSTTITAVGTSARIKGARITAQAALTAGSTVAQIQGAFISANLFGAGGGVDFITGLAVDSTWTLDTSVVSSHYGVYLRNRRTSFTGTVGTYYGFYHFLDDHAVTGTKYAIWLGKHSGGANNYAFWYDSDAVYRINGEGIMAYYNPTFTKYTAGATNFERIIQQWNSDVAEYGVEVGGTGVMRQLRLLGKGVILPIYTTTDRDNLTVTEATLIFNTTTNKLNFYTGSAWEAVTSS